MASRTPRATRRMASDVAGRDRGEDVVGVVLGDHHPAQVLDDRRSRRSRRGPPDRCTGRRRPSGRIAADRGVVDRGRPARRPRAARRRRPGRPTRCRRRATPSASSRTTLVSASSSGLSRSTSAGGSRSATTAPPPCAVCDPITGCATTHSIVAVTLDQRRHHRCRPPPSRTSPCRTGRSSLVVTRGEHLAAQVVASDNQLEVVVVGLDARQEVLCFGLSRGRRPLGRRAPTSLSCALATPSPRPARPRPGEALASCPATPRSDSPTTTSSTTTPAPTINRQRHQQHRRHQPDANRRRRLSSLSFDCSRHRVSTDPWPRRRWFRGCRRGRRGCRRRRRSAGR